MDVPNVIGVSKMVEEAILCEKDMARIRSENSIPISSPLSAGLHRDGTIHIYVSNVDSGLNIGIKEDGTLVVKVDESKRSRRVSGR